MEERKNMSIWKSKQDLESLSTFYVLIRNIMKQFLKYLSLMCLGFFLATSYTFWWNLIEIKEWPASNNLNTQWQGDRGKDRIDRLDDLDDGQNFFRWTTNWERGINNLMINIARDIKNVVFIIATIIMFVLVLRLLFAENSEEEAGKFKSGIIWIALGIVVMQIAFVFYKVMFDAWADAMTATRLSEYILEPFTKLLMTAAAFIFIAICIYAFYKIVTANGNEEAISKWKMSIVYGLIGFIVVKVADVLVESTYGKLKWCDTWKLFTITKNDCITRPEVEWIMWVITTIINWLNGFLGIVIVLLIIYAGFLIMTGSWDEEKASKAKNIIFYAFIGLLVLLMSYLLLTFFIIPESPIGATLTNP